MSDDPTLWRVALELPNAQVDAFEAALEPLVESLMWTVDEPRGMQRIEGFTTVEPNPTEVLAVVVAQAEMLGVDVPKVEIGPLEQRDWVAENLKNFPPIDTGRFFIYASHVEERPLPGRIPMRIDPGNAFGTGTHATTSGCLKALEELGHHTRFKKPLDVGTGSGILAIAMTKMWRLKVLGTDIDPVATAVAKENARLNGVADLLEFRTGTGFEAVSRHDRFDLIVANILARPLTRIAKDVGRAILPGGYVVLSGLIERDERFVLSRYLNQGLMLKRRYIEDGWLTLVLRKR